MNKLYQNYLMLHADLVIGIISGIDFQLKNEGGGFLFYSVLSC